MKNKSIKEKVKLGLKCTTDYDQYVNRIQQKNVDILEFHLTDADMFGEKLVLLEERIKDTIEKGIKPYLHHPMKLNGSYLELYNVGTKEFDFLVLSTKILVELAIKYDIKVVVHFAYEVKYNPFLNVKEEQQKLVGIAKEIDDTYGKGRLLWENGDLYIGSYLEDFSLVNAIKQTSLKLCMDVSHLFLSLKGNNALTLKTIEELQEHIDYYHVVDSFGIVHDGHIIGEGLINWNTLIPYIIERDYIYEVMLLDNDDCTPMLKSHENFKSLVDNYVNYS